MLIDWPKPSVPPGTQTIGFEMEMVAVREDLRDYLEKRVRHLVGPSILEGGVSFCADQSVHRTYKRSTEIRSPILAGPDKAIEVARELIEAIRDFSEVKVGRRCGLHVHVGVPEDVTVLDGYAAVVDYWLPHQNSMFETAFGPKWWDRKEYLYRACYCQLWSYDEVRQSVSRFGALGSNGYNDRYRAFNVFSIRPHKTLEYRLWPMSLDPDRLAVAIRESAAHAASIDWVGVKRGVTRRWITETYETSKKAAEERARQFDQQVLERFLKYVKEERQKK